VVRSICGDGVQVERLDDRVVVRATGEDLERCRRLAEQLEVGPDGWQVEVRLVLVTESLQREIGLGASIGATGRVAGGWGPDAAPYQAYLNAAAEVVLQASEDGRRAAILTDAVLHVLEGGDVRLQQGDVIPVPRRSVSSEGVVQVIGYDQVDTGVVVKVACRRVPDGGGVRR
jgi:type II secretory pathway component GspD/PulD (secretin)